MRLLRDFLMLLAGLLVAVVGAVVTVLLFVALIPKVWWDDMAEKYAERRRYAGAVDELRQRRERAA